MNDKFILSLQGEAQYGRGYGKHGNSLPLLANFYGGGIGSVNGYDMNSLGPRDSNDDPLGGNLSLVGSTHLIFPNFVSDDMRTSLFIDGGNVYNTKIESVQLDQLRYAAGLSVEWRLPIIGVLQLTYARALNAKPGDRTRAFQFSFGTSF